jgi:hypothetical protein
MAYNIYNKINTIKTKVMGCGCKNKGNQQAAQSARPVQEQKNTVPNQTVQDSVKKIVEKYYNKK